MGKTRNTTHAPGPWNIGPMGRDFERPIIANVGGCPDAVIAVVGYDCPEHRIDANARLISAAPELLEACKTEHNDTMDGDILCIIAAWLLRHADTVDAQCGKDKPAYPDMLRAWAGRLLNKQSLQKAAIAKAKAL
jgi:hypothetical protein